jgi:hypothetical protein
MEWIGVIDTNNDSITVVRITLHYPFEARAIRIFPVVANCYTACILKIEAYYEELQKKSHRS